MNGERFNAKDPETIFREVFAYDADPALLADAPPGTPPLPWSNYFVASPDLRGSRARFDLVASVWLDATYPPTTKGEEGLPATYDALRRRRCVAARARVGRSAGIVGRRTGRTGTGVGWGATGAGLVVARNS